MASRLAILLLLLLPSCAGIRAGFIGGVTEGEGDFDGVSAPIVQNTEGSFLGVFISFEVTPSSPPRRAPILSLIDPEPERRPEPLAKPEPAEEPGEALDPLATYGGGGALLIALLTLIKMIPTLTSKPPE